ncbi:MAG: ribonuclease HI family protein [Candidatus Aenigmarchaeota archaeon]|nr:ribonuclease HI family protein [Candidatus Aenigmarchaeota archaeon]
MKTTIYTDGACYPNPGIMGVGIVIEQNNKIIKEISKKLNRGTNNTAEYMAVIIALEEAKKMRISSIDLFIDSALVVGQLEYGYKINKPHLKELNDKVSDLRKEFKKVTIVRNERENNERADRLSKKAIFGP